VVLTTCHEISGIIAVHHKQFNFMLPVAAALMVWVSAPGWAATMAGPSKPDPLLDGGPTAPCAAGADYAAETDVNGAAVAPADVGARPVPVPGAIAIPLNQGRRDHRDRPNSGNPDSAYVSIDGAKLAPLLNPPPCTMPAR
jgi:hypothetical protein